MGQDARPLVPAFLLGLAAVALASLPRLSNIDSYERFLALDELLRTGRLHDTKYSLIGPLAAAPLWLLGRLLGNPEAAVWLFNKLLFFTGFFGLWWALRPAVTADVGRRFLLFLAFASMFPHHLMYFSGEVFTVVCVGVGTAAAVARRAWWGWPLAAIGSANIAATLPALGLAALAASVGRGRMRYVAIASLAVGLFFLENVLRHGGPLKTGYADDRGVASVLPYSGQPGFSYPFFFGLLSVLFSFGKGLIFFAPGLFLTWRKRADEAGGEADLRLLYRVWMAFAIGLVLVYARWWAWYGGYFWGPRFFLFACLPASLVLSRWSAPPVADSLRRNLVLLAAVGLSCWVGADGAVYHQYADEAYLGHDYALEFALWYVPECSPLWRPFVVPKPLAGEDIARLTAFALASAYLLAPVAVAAVRQSRAALGRALSARREWRF